MERIKRFLLFCIVLTLSLDVFAGAYTIPNSDFTNKGWNVPVETSASLMHTNTNYDYDSSVYYNNFGFRHGAIDIHAWYGTDAYAIDDGKIVELYRDDNSSTKNVSILYIKHKTIAGKEFLAIYGHVYAEAGLSIGDTVTKGQTIGTIRKFNTPYHIHFGIGLNTSCHPSGRTGQLFGGIKCGIVNPIDFLKANYNGTPSNNSSVAGIFDGAGSLVNSPQNCYGCNKDVAVMHPHPGTGSTVVFQWKYNGSKCEFLDLTADKNIDVIIKSKNWSKHLTQNAFKTTLSSSPVSLKKADGGWTTFAITSTSSILNETWITARCRKPNDTFHNGSTQSATKDLVDVTHSYYWTGTGSIISQASNEGYGVEYDVAATFSTKKSLTSFQWYTSSTCNKLKIQGSSTFYNNASVSIKGWSNKDFHEVCTTLPCTIAKSAGNYYVIKIKSDANEFGGGTVRASCE